MSQDFDDSSIFFPLCCLFRKTYCLVSLLISMILQEFRWWIITWWCFLDLVTIYAMKKSQIHQNLEEQLSSPFPYTRTEKKNITNVWSLVLLQYKIWSIHNVVMYKGKHHISSSKETEIRSSKQVSNLSIVLLQEHNFHQLCYSELQHLTVAFWVSTTPHSSFWVSCFLFFSVLTLEVFFHKGPLLLLWAKLLSIFMLHAPILSLAALQGHFCTYALLSLPQERNKLDLFVPS